MTLGTLVKEYRDSHGMNMQDFANLCGLSKAYISILERNYNPKSGKPPIPSLETIRAISVVIGRDFNDVIAILDGDQVVALTPEKPAPLAEDVQNTSEQQLLGLYRELNPEGQEKLVDYADDMVRSGKYIKTDPSALGQEA